MSIDSFHSRAAAERAAALLSVRLTPRRTFLGFALLLTLLFASIVARSPMNLSDNKLSPALSDSLADVLTRASNGTYRPIGPLMARAAIQLVGGDEATTLRVLLAAQIAAVCLLLALVLPVTTWGDVAAGMMALSVLIGHHAFRPLANEGYPLNHFALVALFALLAVVLIRRPPGLLNDCLAAVVALVAAFTLESGVLVTGIFLVARPLGLRGVSWRGVGGVVAAFLVYFTARAALLSDGTFAPLLAGHRSGFGFEMLESAAIQARFGDHPWIWYSHNFLAGILSVFVAEPREGQWDFVGSALAGSVDGPRLVEVGASCLTTALIAVTGFRISRPAASNGWSNSMLHDADGRLVGLCVVVIVANGIMCMSYVKEEILSTAAVFYAIAAHVAVRRTIAWVGVTRWTFAAPVTVCALAVGATLWALRASDTACYVRSQAFVKRADWAMVDASRWSPEERALGTRMRQSYIDLRSPPPDVVTATVPCLIRTP